MFGLMVGDGMEGKSVPLFGYDKKEWNGMEENGMHSTLFPHLASLFFPSNLGGMGWNGNLFLKKN